MVDYSYCSCGQVFIEDTSASLDLQHESARKISAHVQKSLDMAIVAFKESGKVIVPCHIVTTDYNR